MDFARKIGKSDKPRIWKRIRAPFATTTDNFIIEDTPFSEDRRLVNWKRWLADRKKQSCRVESVTGRSHIDQLQSSSEKFRAFVEMKDLMERAALPMSTDKYRGGPEFWRTPESLPDRCDDALPKISLTLTRKELNLPPDLTHVELPDLTASERSAISLKTKEELWQRSDYLKSRKLELAKEIALLLPKEPEMATLVVQGRALRKRRIERRRKPQPPRKPLITVTEADEERLRENIDRTAILKIQDREFIWRRSLPTLKAANSGPIVWSLIFESKIDERVEREIVLENKGTRVIVYYWRQDSSFRPTSMPFGIRGSTFFFNKTKELVLPGQIVKIKVWFRSRASGVFAESWRLVTEPRFSTSAFVFRFWGCAAIHARDAESDNRRSIDEYLDRCVRDSAVRLIVEEIIAGVEHGKPPEPVYKTLFLQRELFASRNPCYFYHPSYVSQLREMYRDVTDENVPPWNFSLEFLRDVLLRIEEADYRRDKLARFNELCKRCLRPNLYDVARHNKRDAVYDVLCAFANLFEDESEFAKESSLIREEPVLTSEVYRQKSTTSSHRSNDSSQEAHRIELTDRSQSTQAQIERSFDSNPQLRSEIFFIRIYGALEEAIERICAIIDSFNRLDKPDK